MKRLLYILCVLFALTSCSKDENEDEPNVKKVTFITYQVSTSGEHMATEGVFILYLFPDVVFTQTYEYKDSDCRIYPWQLFLNSDISLHKGVEEVKYAYMEISYSPTFALENIRKGNYAAVMLYKCKGYSFSNFYHYGYKQISITEDYQRFNMNFPITNRGKWTAL